MLIFPLREGEWCSLGQLREGVKAVFNRADFDKEFRHAMRENDQRRVPWAKAWTRKSARRRSWPAGWAWRMT